MPHTRTRTWEKAGFFRAGSTRPEFPGFGLVFGLKISKSGFRAGFQDPEKTRIL